MGVEGVLAEDIGREKAFGEDKGENGGQEEDVG